MRHVSAATTIPTMIRLHHFTDAFASFRSGPAPRRHDRRRAQEIADEHGVSTALRLRAWEDVRHTR
jgi:hypothetical protein